MKAIFWVFMYLTVYPLLKIAFWIMETLGAIITWTCPDEWKDRKGQLKMKDGPPPGWP